MGINRQIVIDVKNDISAAILEFFREKKSIMKELLKKNQILQLLNYHH